MKTLNPKVPALSPQMAGDIANQERFIGIDAGAETIKLVELCRTGTDLRIGRQLSREHNKQPGPVLLQMLTECDWATVNGAAVTGRFAAQVRLLQLPVKQAQLRGYQFRQGDGPATLINIGSHGFSVLEIREGGRTVFRENSRCSQGTGNFLRQLVERFSLSVEEASRLCANVAEPAALSGRCPVILKTDMTHLANKGEERARILAGLFDAVCQNVLVLLKPGVSPSPVFLMGGVSRSPRVQRVIGEMLAEHGMKLAPMTEEGNASLEALGCAVVAAEKALAVPPLREIILPPRPLKLEKLPALALSLSKVHRLPMPPRPELNGEVRRLVLGFDIGSTGAKLVAIDAVLREPVWDAYRQTLGDPVAAAQELLRRFSESPASRYPVFGFGATGSGREVAGSLLISCYGKNAVFIVNELVAHATGALHYDSEVDTIFEIGGQDAKYIRLAEGRITDCAMNEACSAGTGSFIEEQGRKFAGMTDVCKLGQAALEARSGVSLGQHCSVFMAEVIDEGVAGGIEEPALISGLYDSIIKNYLNRVKGNRSVGKRIFCQGMPFAADALAAAVARQTDSEVIVPPNPGTVGALGIALLAARELEINALPPLELMRFLDARVQQKDSFLCRATVGCGGSGNRCRIERLRTVVSAQSATFTWGGGCALHDKATRKRKLPDLAPDPFREREALVQQVIARYSGPRGNPRIALTDEFVLKGLFPFFAAFFYEAGFDLSFVPCGDHAALKKGIQSAVVPFCAPMQFYHGVAQQLAAAGADWVFIPMLRNLPKPKGQQHSVVCPIVQSAPNVVSCALKLASSGVRGRTASAEDPMHAEAGKAHSTNPCLLTTCIDFSEGELNSPGFVSSIGKLARRLRLSAKVWRKAWGKGVECQRDFENNCRASGERAIRFCKTQNIVPVVVLGRDYTIHNRVLNSNVPAILREQGAIAIPADCYPLPADAEFFPDMYWGYGQALLRAAHQVRRTPGVYALYCSNYSCGPDSFNLHFCAYVMEGKPFAIIETDGHCGDAGTKTRVEAFLHCVEEDRREISSDATLNDFSQLKFSGLRPRDIGRHNGTTEQVLLPWMGANSDAAAAVLRGIGFAAEALPPPDMESMRLGRRYTSGKECLPMPLTLGTLLRRLDRARPGERFVYVMPSTYGPCRFGVYNLLNQIVLQRLGWREHVRIWSPNDSSYFSDLPAGTEILLLIGFCASDALHQCLLDVRPFEKEPGVAQSLYEFFLKELLSRLETAGRAGLSLAPALWEAVGGNLYGVRKLLADAGRQFASLRGPGQRPVVELTGEIYVRAVPFSNDFLIQKLEQRGLQVRLAPQTEWLDYCAYLSRQKSGPTVSAQFNKFIQHRIETVVLSTAGAFMGWPPVPSIEASLVAAEPYVSPALEGEAVLTLGAALEAWRQRQIDAVLSVGPLECMPTKIAEAQFQHLSEREGLLNLTLMFNGEPIGDTALDNFAFEVLNRFNRRFKGARFATEPLRGPAALEENGQAAAG